MIPAIEETHPPVGGQTFRRLTMRWIPSCNVTCNVVLLVTASNRTPAWRNSVPLSWFEGYFPIWAPTTTRKQRIDDGKFQTWMKCFIPLKNRKGILQPAMLVFQGGPKYSSLVAELSPSLILFQIWSILEVKDKMPICWICCFEIIPYHNTGLYGKPISTKKVDLDFQKVDTSVFHQQNTAAKTCSKDHTMTTIRLPYLECDETSEGKWRSRDSKPCNIWWKNLPSIPFPLGCFFWMGGEGWTCSTPNKPLKMVVWCFPMIWKKTGTPQIGNHPDFFLGNIWWKLSEENPLKAVYKSVLVSDELTNMMANTAIWENMAS